MTVECLGQFLVDENYITPQQLVETTGEPPPNKVLAFAIAKGILLESEVQELFDLYGNDPAKAIEKAIKNGNMVQDQLDFLHRLLRNDARDLAASLIRDGILTEHTLSLARAAFAKTQMAYALRPKQLLPNAGGRDDIIVLLNLTEAYFERLTGFSVAIDAPTEQPLADLQYGAEIPLHGEFHGGYVFSADPQLAHHMLFATLGLSGPAATPEVLEDVVAEFSNSVAGAAAGMLSMRGMELTFDSPLHFSKVPTAGRALPGGTYLLQTPNGFGIVRIY